MCLQKMPSANHAEITEQRLQEQVERLREENAELRRSILGCIRHQRERVERSEGTHLTKQGLALTVLRDLESQIQAGRPKQS